jgi:hypothetical protein
MTIEMGKSALRGMRRGRAIDMVRGKSDIHESMWRMKWSTLPLLAVTAACVDPIHSYDDWLSRTADARSAPGPAAVDAGATDTGAPAASFDRTYLMVCLSSLSSGNASEALLFKARATFTPAGASGGTLDFSQIPLVVHAQDLSKTAPLAMLVTVNGSPVAADGTSDVHIGATTIPKEADPIGADIVFTDSSLHFHVSADHLCASLSGQVSQPLSTVLDPAQSFCIFRSPTPPFPTFQASDFHCP